MSKKKKKTTGFSKFVPNGHAILILASGGKGKTYSLKNIRNKKKCAYLNTDAKPLPFFPKNKKDVFGLNAYVKRYKDVKKYLKKINKQSSNVPETVILDTLTHLMGMFTLQCVDKAANTQAAWQQYLFFYRKIMLEIKTGAFNTIVMGHLTTVEDDDGKIIDIVPPMQGQLKRIGINTDFSTILECVTINPLKYKAPKNSKFYHVTQQELDDKLKYVFLTRKVKKHKFTLARVPDGLFPREDLYIDNDVQMVLDQMDKKYSGK